MAGGVVVSKTYCLTEEDRAAASLVVRVRDSGLLDEEVEVAFSVWERPHPKGKPGVRAVCAKCASLNTPFLASACVHIRVAERFAYTTEVLPAHRQAELPLSEAGS